MALTGYLLATRRLLHDASGKTYSDSELTTYINSARQRIGLDTGAVRGLITFFMSASQESYPYSGAVASRTSQSLIRCCSFPSKPFCIAALIISGDSFFGTNCHPSGTTGSCLR